MKTIIVNRETWRCANCPIKKSKCKKWGTKPDKYGNDCPISQGGVFIKVGKQKK
jgi:hypothetical protein